MVFAPCPYPRPSRPYGYVGAPLPYEPVYRGGLPLARAEEGRELREHFMRRTEEYPVEPERDGPESAFHRDHPRGVVGYDKVHSPRAGPLKEGLEALQVHFDFFGKLLHMPGVFYTPGRRVSIKIK